MRQLKCVAASSYYSYDYRENMSADRMRNLQRRKSAHGRLQSSASLANTVKVDGTAEGGCGRSRRVKSASVTRQERAAAELPSLGGRSASDTWGSTQYGDDFGHKQPLTPVPVRPISPTRRNNPHPAKPFLQWKIPVRIHTHKNSVHPPEEVWKYVSEGFYEDYTDTYNTGDAKNEVPVTNVATIEFPGNKKNGALSAISGTKVQLNSRSVGTGGPTASIRPPSPKSRMMHNTVRINTLPFLQEWLKTASKKERDLVFEMLTAAHSDSEEKRLQRAVESVLQPDSTSRVQQWLRSATSSEKKILLNVLETLAVASDDIPPPSQLILPAATWHQPNKNYRLYSCPITLCPWVKSHAHNSSHKGHYSHHNHHHQTSSHHKAHCHKAHRSSGHMLTDCGKKETESDMTLVGKRVGIKYEKSPELWHHKVPPVAEELRVLHPGSVFQQPHKNRGRHYAIHPEWPTA